MVKVSLLGKGDPVAVGVVGMGSRWGAGIAQNAFWLLLLLVILMKVMMIVGGGDAGEERRGKDVVCGNVQ